MTETPIFTGFSAWGPLPHCEHTAADRYSPPGCCGAELSKRIANHRGRSRRFEILVRGVCYLAVWSNYSMGDCAGLAIPGRPRASGSSSNRHLCGAGPVWWTISGHGARGPRHRAVVGEGLVVEAECRRLRSTSRG